MLITFVSEEDNKYKHTQKLQKMHSAAGWVYDTAEWWNAIASIRQYER